MEKTRVYFQGKEYILLIQYASGYCEIVETGALNNQVKLVHFSELNSL
ncbi:hypothetical protein J7E63_02440 [Bacillus sp. ISL-75]|nr:hypothetical protein [Bacillus sp. ISL-75]MBT2725793.1 hypothetical protein [Bacillus sp. ISL-75]